MDGVPGVGRGQHRAGRATPSTSSRPSRSACTSTTATRSPLADHIAKGLYGAFVIDPKEGRPEADELVMVMNGFDTNFDRSNEVYAVNTVAFAYQHEPVRVKRDELVRIYLVNALEFDLVNSFHVHANFFHYFPTGTSLEPTELTDTVIQGQGQRGILELRFPYEGKYMFHAHVSEFAELGWMGFFEVVVMEAAAARRAPALARRAAAAGAARRADRASSSRSTRPGSSATASRSRRSRSSAPSCIRARSSCTLQNDGPDAVRIVQAIVNDGFAAFTQDDDELGRLDRSKVTIDYPWIEGEAYEVVLLTSTGGTVDTSIEVAAETPDADAGFYGLMGLIGLYVGIIPVAIGMLWLPWMRQLDRRWLQFLLALTIGLLVFLGIDAALEGLELGALGCGVARRWRADVAGRGARVPGARRRGRLARTRRGGGGERVALLVAIGIGLHNLGEGLVIGSAYAVGSLALGAALVVGFAIHNTTEGLAIVAPVAEQQPRVARLALLGLIAGAPAILGAWIGASAFDPSLAAFMFGLGVGAIARVVVQIAPAGARRRGPPAAPARRRRARGRARCSCTPPSLLISV